MCVCAGKSVQNVHVNKKEQVIWRVLTINTAFCGRGEEDATRFDTNTPTFYEQIANLKSLESGSQTV